MDPEVLGSPEQPKDEETTLAAAVEVQPEIFEEQSPSRGCRGFRRVGTSGEGG